MNHDEPVHCTRHAASQAVLRERHEARELPAPTNRPPRHEHVGRALVGIAARLRAVAKQIHRNDAALERVELQTRGL